MAKSLLKMGVPKKKPTKSNRGLESSYMGDEPIWDDCAFLSEDNINSRLVHAYNWYNYFYEPKVGRGYLIDYMTMRGMSKAAMSMINRVSDSVLNSTMCNTSRMINMGLESDRLTEKLNSYLVMLVEKGVEIEKNEKSVAMTIIPKNPASDIICDIEQMIDNTALLPSEGFYSWLKDKKNIKPQQTRAIIDKYSPWLAELREAETTKDPDLKYAYRHMTKKNFKDRIAMFAGMISDCESLLVNSRKVTTTTRAPRKTKPKSADKIVAKIVFQKEDTNLKIASIAPVRIVGATELWIFNTKYNTLAHYVANDGGLSMKGTTLQNFGDKSKQKKLRKPADVLNNITSSTSKAAERAFESIKTKDAIPNGRINEHTILLRAVK